MSSTRTRPEHTAPAEVYYSAEEAAKYTVNSRIQFVQKALAERALELLNLPADESCFIADLGTTFEVTCFFESLGTQAAEVGCRARF
jgi:hypothetical protein